MTLTAPQYTIGANQPGGKQTYCLNGGMYVSYGGDSSSTSAANNNTAMNNLQTHISSVIGKPHFIESLMVGCSFGGMSGRLNTIDTHNPRHLCMEYAIMPSNGTLAAAKAGSYTSTWTADATALKNSAFNTAQVTLGPMWEGSANGATGSFPWAIGVNSQTAADFALVYRMVHNAFIAAGVSTAVTWDWNVMNQTCTLSDLNACYPGDAYVDVIGYDAYNNNHGTTNKTDYNYIWTTWQKPALDLMTAFARSHSKLCGSLEAGMIMAAPGDTTSNTYKYQSADTNLYWAKHAAYLAANADVWAYFNDFNQNVGNPTSQECQEFFCGTDPATQNSLNYHSTNYTTGTWYDTIAPSHTKSHADYLASMCGVTLQLPEAPQSTSTVGASLTRSAQNYFNVFA